MTALRRILIALVLLPCLAAPATAGEPWRELEPGLELGEFVPQGQPVRYAIAVVRMDPARWSLRLLCAEDQGVEPMTVEQWAQRFGLAAAINASMYLREDHLRSTGYMRSGPYVNNPVINARFGAFLAFGPRHDALPPVQIVDRYAQEWEALLDDYESVIQNFRMLSVEQKNQWPQDQETHSIAAVGMDNAGRVLLIHSREPYSVHDFTETLLRLPIGLYNAMYVEGGPEAGLYVHAGGYTGRWMGSWEKGTFLGGSSHRFWGVPNVIGVVRAEAGQ